jgi:hypothetical protein
MIQQDVADEFVATLLDFIANGPGQVVAPADRAKLLQEMVAG